MFFAAKVPRYLRYHAIANFLCIPGEKHVHRFACAEHADIYFDYAVNNILMVGPPAEDSRAIAERVAAARAIQKARYAGLNNDPPIRTNAEADGTLLEKIAAPDDAGRKLLAEAADRLKLSARGYHRMLRVARTLADLEGAESVRRIHIAEALSFRRIAPNRAGA